MASTSSSHVNFAFPKIGELCVSVCVRPVYSGASLQAFRCRVYVTYQPGLHRRKVAQLSSFVFGIITHISSCRSHSSLREYNVYCPRFSPALFALVWTAVLAVARNKPIRVQPRRHRIAQVYVDSRSRNIRFPLHLVFCYPCRE